MMSYKAVLPQVFPYVIMVPARRLQLITNVLLATDLNCLNGSSFAVTCDARQDWLWLWVSKVSYERLVNQTDLLKGLSPVPVRRD